MAAMEHSYRSFKIGIRDGTQEDGRPYEYIETQEIAWHCPEKRSGRIESMPYIAQRIC